MKLTKKCELSVIEIGLIRREKTGLALRNVQKHSKTDKKCIESFENSGQVIQKLYTDIQKLHRNGQQMI
jgi:hypothetical protein